MGVTPSPRRIGLYGGAFDPPHEAHHSLAQAALEQLGLDLLLVLPTGQAWHKARPLTDAVHRVAMCRLAFGDLARTRIDEREVHRPGPTYTIDTLEEVAAEHPGARLFLIMGADQLHKFRTWYRWRDILSLATLAVARRAERVGDDALSPQHPPSDLSAVDVPFVTLAMPPLNVSATALRHHLREDWRDGVLDDVPLVSPAVAGYISTHNLYQNPT
jgi:nicotinate-nucleotide adenylyltransferase